MVYVQYYDEYGNEILGDRGVVILDGRNSLETMHNDAIAFNGIRRPTYNAYRIFSGRRFSDSQPITKLHKL